MVRLKSGRPFEIVEVPDDNVECPLCGLSDEEALLYVIRLLDAGVHPELDPECATRVSLHANRVLERKRARKARAA